MAFGVDSVSPGQEVQSMDVETEKGKMDQKW